MTPKQRAEQLAEELRVLAADIKFQPLDRTLLASYLEAYTKRLDQVVGDLKELAEQLPSRYSRRKKE